VKKEDRGGGKVEIQKATGGTIRNVTLREGVETQEKSTEGGEETL